MSAVSLGCGKRLFIPVARWPSRAEIAGQIERARTWPYANIPPPEPGSVVFDQRGMQCGAVVPELGGKPILCRECQP